MLVGYLRQRFGGLIFGSRGGYLNSNCTMFVIRTTDVTPQ